MLIIPKEYTQKLQISSFDADRERNLRMSSQMKLQQEVGELHLQSGGLPYSKLFDEMRKVWVLTRTKTVRKRTPKFEEHITLTTWSSQIKGAQFFRAYEFRNLNGEVLISAVSSFALVDAVTHELLRPSVLNDEVEFNCIPDKDLICGQPERIRIRGELVECCKREIKYTDIDYNNHLNNTIYCDFIADYLPFDLANGTIAEFEINYLKEGLLGDILDISVYIDENTAYFNGEHSRGCCFTAKAIYRQD